MTNALLSIGLSLAIGAILFGGILAYIKIGPRFQRHFRYYEQSHKEHEAGWRILLDGECIAELEYLHDDQPFHLFRFISRTDDQQKLDYALQSTAMRKPDSRIQFQNRVFSVSVPDGPFLANLHDDTVYIRDFRIPGDTKSTAANA
jgi:hypothetical protein